MIHWTNHIRNGRLLSLLSFIVINGISARADSLGSKYPFALAGTTFLILNVLFGLGHLTSRLKQLAEFKMRPRLLNQSGLI